MLTEYFSMLDVNAISGLVGNAIQILSICGAGLMMFFAMRGDIRVIRHDISNLQKGQESLNEAFKQLGAILTQVAVQDTRISMIEKDVDELRHGEGFVNGHKIINND